MMYDHCLMALSMLYGDHIVLCHQIYLPELWMCTSCWLDVSNLACATFKLIHKNPTSWWLGIKDSLHMLPTRWCCVVTRCSWHLLMQISMAATVDNALLVAFKWRTGCWLASNCNLNTAWHWRQKTKYLPILLAYLTCVLPFAGPILCMIKELEQLRIVNLRSPHAYMQVECLKLPLRGTSICLGIARRGIYQP